MTDNAVVRERKTPDAEKGTEPFPCEAKPQKQNGPSQKASDIEPFDNLLSHQFCVGLFDLLPGGFALIAFKVPVIIGAQLR
jgi:hypothetical protein